jgi:hypothetical protein
LAKLPCSTQKTSQISFAEGMIDSGRCAAGGSMIFLTKIAIRGLATILITYVGFIGN